MTPPPSPLRSPSFAVAGLCVSADGLAALRAFFKGLPRTDSAAFVVVPDHQSGESVEFDALGRTVPLPVHRMTDRVEVEPGHVYLVPPRQALVVKDGHLALTLSEVEQGEPLEHLLRTLAAAYGTRAVAVALSEAPPGGVTRAQTAVGAVDQAGLVRMLTGGAAAASEARAERAPAEKAPEDLRATVEELQAANASLTAKVDSLSRAKRDLEDVLVWTEIATLFLDHQFRIQRFTPRAREHFHILDSDIGRPLAHLVPKFRDARLMDDVEAALERGAVAEREFQNEDGRWFLVHVRPHRSDEGPRQGAVVTFVEITERKRVEEALQESEERFRLMADAVPQIVWITDADGLVEFLNRRWPAYTGKPNKPMTVEEVAASALHPDDVAITVERFEEARRTGGSFLVEHRIRSAAGDYRWFLVRGEPYRDPETGRITRWFGTSVDIHDRKLAEAAQRESEERYRLMVEGAREYAIFMTCPEGRITSWSTGAERVLGFSEAEVLGQPDAMIFTAEDQSAGVPERELAAAAAEGQAMDERLHVRKDGSEFWASGMTTALYEPDGSLRGFVKVLRDNTKRKVAEEALRASEARFRAAAETVPDVLFTTTPDGLVDYVNPRLEEITGARPRDVLGTPIWPDLFHPDDRDEAEAVWAAARNEERPYENRHRLHLVSGSYGWFLTRARPVRGAEGRVMKWYGTCTDINRIVRAESEVQRLNATLEARVEERTRELAASEERFRALVNASAQAVWMTDAEGRVVEDSPSWRAYTGQTVEEWLGSGWRDVVHPDEREAAAARWRHAIATETPLDAELRLHHAASGTWRWVHVRAVPLHAPDGAVRGWVGMSTDIHERKQAEERVHELARALTIAEQEERRRIAHLLHDDLQQQLYGLGMTLSLLRRPQSEEEALRLYAQAEEILDEATAMTRQLAIELSPPVLQAAGLEEILRWIAERQWAQLGLEVGVEVEADSPLPDHLRVLLYQALREVLFNVVKHAGTQEAHIRARASADRVVVCVEDEGAGFDVQAVESEKSGDRGFGLLSVQERVELAGGEVEFDSAPERGTRVTITLPLRDAGQPAR